MSVIDTSTPAAAQMAAVRDSILNVRHLLNQPALDMLWDAYNHLNEATPETYTVALSYWTYVMVRLEPLAHINPTMTAMGSIRLAPLYAAVHHPDVAVAA